MRYSAEQKADEARRELAYRRRVYGRMVSEGKMKQAHAEEKIAIMSEIEADYRAQVKKAEPRLFE